MGTPAGLFGLGTAVRGTTASMPRLGGLQPKIDAGSEVQALLAQLEGFRLPEPPPKVGKGRKFLGRLGDALLAAATVKAGGIPPALGPFAANLRDREEIFRADTARAEAANRDLRDRIRVRQFEREQDRKIRVRSSTDVKDTKTTITQSMIDRFGLDPSRLGEFVTVRDRIDKVTGQTISREIVGPADTADKVSTKEFETTITKDMVKRFGLPKESTGTFARVRDIVDAKTGITIKREILGPGVESTSPVVTTEGIFPRGTKTGRLDEALIHPETGELLRPFQEELLFLRQQVEADNKKKKFQLPARIVKDLTEEGISVTAAEAALRRYIDLGSPDLGILFSMTPDRFKPARAVAARRAIAEAVVPVRRFFSGAAVTKIEAQFAAPLIANIDGPIAPNILKESLLGLINISRRARQRILLDARATGLDISGFESELTSGKLDPINSLEEFTSGAKKNGENRRLRDRVVVENGQLKIEAP